MKRIAITITLDCRDDVPPHVLEWMAENLLEHATNEFGCDYDPEFVEPPYEDRPLLDDGDHGVEVA